MKPFQNFYFTGHSFDAKTLKASFSYSFDYKVYFTEEIDFSCPGFNPIKDINQNIINNLLFHLSIALGISYYKLFPTSNLIVEHSTLNNDQISFWKKFYLNGLGEFFFKNKLSPKGLLNFASKPSSQKLERFTTNSSQVLIAIGGGKDSLVSIELIKKMGIPFCTTTFGKDYPIHQSVSKQIAEPRLIIQRRMDPLLFQMNEEGYYNGHIPISGIIAFVLSTAAYLYDYRSIIMSNEKSANEGNTEIDGMMVNHQRSKSLEFEKDFSEYLREYISQDIRYFSLLRGMYEIKITELFSHYPQYFDTFSSCNTNFTVRKDKGTTQKRCGKCPKCTFVYTLMSAFVDQKKVNQIFNKDLFADPQLETTFRELLGISGIKPFECVGTPEEVILAMHKYYEKTKKTRKSHQALPYIMQIFEKEVLPKMSQADFIVLEEKLMKVYDEDNIPSEIKKKLFTE